MNEIIDRNSYIEKIKPFIDKDIIKVLVGVRRSGKSILLDLIKKHLMKNGINEKQLISYNFESYQTLHLRSDSDLYKEINNRIEQKGKKHYIFFDEIQEVANWEKIVNSLRVDFNVDIYLTGSNAQLLSGELATYLAGRYIEIPVYPFSYKEFSNLVQNINLHWNDEDKFTKYVLLGGMPFLGNLNFEEQPTIQYLEDIYRSVLLKDVIERNNIRDVDLLERILVYIISNIGRTFSAKNISDFFKSENRKVASETVYNYLNACENACLLYKVPRQDLVGKKILKIQEKIFIVDHGLRQAVYGNNQQNIDQILENIVFIELLRRDYKITIGKYKDKEIDFVAEKGNKREYYQVCYLLSSKNVIEREFSVLENIRDNFPKFVLSLDKFNFSRNGIDHINIKDFLLN